MSLNIPNGLLNQDHPQPLYLQLSEYLRSAIAEGRLAPGEALPAERDIAEELGVSRITVRKAIEVLVRDSLVERRQGSGTFVSSRIEKSFSTLSSFSEDMAARGWKASSQWLDRSTGSVSPEEALALVCGPGERVFRFRRIRFADEKPLAIEHSTIPSACLRSASDVTESLYAALEANGCRPTRALQRLQAVAFDEEQARILGVEVGAPGLLISRRSYLDDGRAVESTHSWYRGDVYDFVAELSI